MSKVILITGASSGMGKEAAKKLIQQGHKVYTAARRIDQMQDLKTMGGFPLQMDISQEADVQKTVDTIIQAEGKIDVLWNNAGYGLYGAVEDIPISEARKQFEVNLFGLASLTQKVTPYMRAAQSGTIINTSSMGGKMYTPMGAWYHATKHALEGWSDCLRIELQPFNIKVVVLEPGIIETEFGSVMLDSITQFSGKGPYKGIVDKLVAATHKMYEQGGTKTSVIADTIVKIVNSANPKTRYRVGKLAKPMVWLRVYLGDKLFDRIIMSQI
ncbi:MAG TPA: oxidoreductase [Haliscomenobacter sp.]|uniref:oxidoreductase n=1 Tax=Haliscomenobacter sp. TaxID=2717303 RepID=UPI002C668EAC|nr:oxidoreductase [Haliscomenobacter sp.]HOY19426.1 oxidoreductase [Haliscomenobacter sp.]HPH21952.1 oxidoreductase [Haliscomenobacter sp.]